MREAPRDLVWSVWCVWCVCSIVLLAVAGCSSIPMHGPVRAGQAAEPTFDAGYRVQPLGPVNGESPADVVRGFYLAGVGVDDDFSAARQFLTATRREAWRPTTRTVVHPLGSLGVNVTAMTTSGGQGVPLDHSGDDAGDDPGGADSAAKFASVSVHAEEVGEVDASGQYVSAAPGLALDVVLHLVKEDGQWRIADAPDLLLLDDPDFRRVFLDSPVYFADRTDGQLVGEQRWVLDRSSSATTLVADLLAGPSATLAPAVTGGAPSSSSLGSGSVVVSDGVATVDLPQRLGNLPAASLRMLQQQVTATLEGLPQVSSVQMTVDGGSLPDVGDPRIAGVSGDQSDVPGLTGSATDDPVVVSKDSVARLTGDALTQFTVTPALTGVSSPATSQSQVAALVAGRSQLVRVNGGHAGTVLTGTALTAPSFDRHGWLWSTSALCPGTVTAVSRSGEVAQVSAPSLAGRTLTALRLSPDGTRALIASTGPSGPAVEVAAVRRQADGTPTALAKGSALAPWLAQVRAIAWVGQDLVAVLGQAAADSAQGQAQGTSPTVWVLTGGREQYFGAPGLVPDTEADGSEATQGPSSVPGPDPVSLTAGAGVRTLLLGTADGRLWQPAGVDWASLTVTASDPAYPG